MNGVNAKRVASIIAGILSALGLAYAGLAQIWDLPMANEINQSLGVVVQLISAVLAAFTGKSIADDNKG